MQTQNQDGTISLHSLNTLLQSLLKVIFIVFVLVNDCICIHTHNTSKVQLNLSIWLQMQSERFFCAKNWQRHWCKLSMLAKGRSLCFKPLWAWLVLPKIIWYASVLQVSDTSSSQRKTLDEHTCIHTYIYIKLLGNLLHSSVQELVLKHVSIQTCSSHSVAHMKFLKWGTCYNHRQLSNA